MNKPPDQYFITMTKRVFFLLSALLLVSLKVFAYVDTDAPILPLPKGNEVGMGLIVAIITIPLGFLLLKRSNIKNMSLGCLCELLIIVGIIGLIPLLMWIFEAVSAIAFIIIIIGIIAGVYFTLKK